MFFRQTFKHYGSFFCVFRFASKYLLHRHSNSWFIFMRVSFCKKMSFREQFKEHAFFSVCMLLLANIFHTDIQTSWIFFLCHIFFFRKSFSDRYSDFISLLFFLCISFWADIFAPFFSSCVTCFVRKCLANRYSQRSYH